VYKTKPSKKKSKVEEIGNNDEGEEIASNGEEIASGQTGLNQTKCFKCSKLWAESYDQTSWLSCEECNNWICGECKNFKLCLYSNKFADYSCPFCL
jgi:hypothetical protein